MIHGFFGDGESRLGSLLRAFLNDLPILPSSELCRVMADETSDKGLGRHNYTLLYDRLLAPMRNSAKLVVEIGIGSKGAFPCAMIGHSYKVGASLRGWRRWFPHAEIVGGDIDAAALFTEDRIMTYQIDQMRPDSIAGFWNTVGSKHGSGCDLILDDGWHHHPANECLLLNSISNIRVGGFYIIEDIQTNPANLARFHDTLTRLGRPAALITIPHRPDPGDNTIAVIC